MRNFLLAFFFLFAGLVQAYEVKLDTFGMEVSVDL